MELRCCPHARRFCTTSSGFCRPADQPDVRSRRHEKKHGVVAQCGVDERRADQSARLMDRAGVKVRRSVTEISSEAFALRRVGVTRLGLPDRAADGTAATIYCPAPRLPDAPSAVLTIRPNHKPSTTTTLAMSRPSSMMATSSAMAQRNLTLTEELEKLEQSITLTLQGAPPALVLHLAPRADQLQKSTTTSVAPTVSSLAVSSP